MAEPLRWRALNQPDGLAYNFLADGEDVEQRVTYAELDARARAVERLLQSHHARGERVLLLYPPGLDYIAALFGCLYAGAVAVPAYPPDSGRLTRSLPRLQAIVTDSEAHMALTTTPMLEKMPAILAAAPHLGTMRWLATDQLAPVAPDGDDFEPEPGSLAFLQYTSGSTAAPKGVMITHANIVANQEMIAQAFGSSPDEVGVGWLPFYHDMGLIGNVFHPMYAGYQAILMSPISFLQRPVRWLRAISKYGGTVSGGPNFAYDSCVQRISEEERASLDLSSWTTAFNGAEPIRAATLERFAAAFAPSGFSRKALLPCYGLAETTLIATCAPKQDELSLRQPRADEPPGRRPVVGCGHTLGTERVLVVDPTTLVPCEPGREGEIWVAGPNVASGYWRRIDESERTFRAQLASGQGPFLRTGDLGVLEGRELFVTGRIKDVVIVRGRNIYPQDVELSVELAHPGVRGGCIVAFAAAAGDGEGLGVAAEIKAVLGDDELKALCSAIVAAVTEEHQVAPSVVLLLARGGIPKTSSGKLQRQAVRIAVDSGTIKATYIWRDGASTGLQPAPAAAGDEPQPAEPAPVPPDVPIDPLGPAAGETEVRAFLLDWLSRSLGVAPASIDRRVPLSNYGLASRDAVALSGALEDWLGRRISPTIAYEHPTVEKLVAQLVAMKHHAPASWSSPPQATAPGDGEAIAIVGLGCRVPGAENPEALWRLLAEGRNSAAEVPLDRFDLASSYDEAPARGRTYVKRAAMLDRVDAFDARFFGISTSEAISLDPQQRLLLEVTWEALEDAGFEPEALKGTAAGVFVGISPGDYAAKLRHLGQLGQIDAYSGTGALPSTAAGRISYLLGTHGPSLAIDTACSSSLVAVHLGCQSLRNGESDLVVAGGVSLILAPDSFIYLSQLHALAPDGLSKTFDAAADGYGRGEGCAIVVLKRLGDALAAGDTVLAVIRGSAVNHDGATNGMTAPSGAAQQAVIGAALARAGVLPHQVDYLEAHGTGTPLGDLVELEAIGGMMARNRTTALRVGSVKTNIGHLEAAAGVVGLVKTVLSLQHGAIPPHVHLRQPNPGIDWAALQMEVPVQSSAWPRGSRPRLAGVSSFGLSGTNAHVIVGEPPELPPREVRALRPVTILPWSASSPEALQEMGRRISDWMVAHEHAEIAPSEIAASLAHARAGRRHRAAVVGAGIEELVAGLARAPAPSVARPGPFDRPARVGFLFSGQGSQYPSMGAELDRTEAPFHLALDRCAAVLDGRLGRPLRDLLFDADAAAMIRETRFTQPLMVSLQYALAELWRAWGIEPVVVMGHSVGEISAACIAGILSIEDALVLAMERGRLIDEHCPRGAMIAAVTTEERIRQAIASRDAGRVVTIAALNAPDRVVFSGDEADVLAIGEDLASEGISVERLDVSHAFHSPHMDRAMAPLATAAARLKLRPAGTAFVSTCTGRVLEPAAMDPGHWVAQLRQPVRFAEAVRALDAFDLDAIVEVGPQATLLALHRRAAPDSKVLRVASLDRSGAECKRMLGSLATLFAGGADVRWDEVVGPRPKPVPRLPTYPFQRERFWIDEAPFDEVAVSAGSRAAAQMLPRPPVAANGIAAASPDASAATDHRSGIAMRLREIIGELLRLPPEQIDEHMQLADMGVDSLIFIDGLQRVQQETGIRIPLREVWSGLDTIERLADYIARARLDSPGAALPAAPGHIVERAGRSAPISVEPASAAALTERQRAHIALLAERHNARTAGSKRRKLESHPVLADARAAAGYRVDMPAAQRQMWLATKELAYPIVGQRSRGSRIWDVDGNEYVDFTMGFGVHLFGHGAPFLVQAVEDELRRGAQIGPQSERAAEAAQLIQELTGVERLTFCVTGSEAVMVALRLARARVGRPRIAAFAGSYHGSYDGVLPVIPLTHGIPAAVDEDVMVLEYGNPRSLELIEQRAAELSAVLVEPVQSRRPELQPREFLHRLREITARHGIALIFDEVLVGFRIAAGGAQAHFGVQADIVTYGKIVGGGLPVGVVAGRAEYLDAIDGGAWSYGNASAPGIEGVWHAGTFNKNPLAMAASVAALRRLRSEGPGLQERLNERTAGLVRQLNTEFARAGAPIEAVHFGSLMRLQMPRSLDLLYTHLIEQGVYVWEGRSMFLSTEHSDEDLTRLVGAMREALAQLRKGGFLAERTVGQHRRPGHNGAAPVTRTNGARRARKAKLPLLFCFPYAGGSTTTFVPWSARLAEVAEVVPVILPGHDARAAEMPITDYDTLVELLADQVAEQLADGERSFAFFGHSMGALLAFGVARKLSLRDRRPGLLLVSGEPAPHLSKTAAERPIHLLDDAALLDALARHGVPIDLRASGLVAADLQVLRADLALCQDFRLDDDAEPLDCRIVGFAGSTDPLGAERDVAAWARHTNDSFALHVLPGGHFFIRSEREALLDFVAAELTGPAGPVGKTTSIAHPDAIVRDDGLRP